MDKKIKVIVSGGGTGGHIFPAISIANAIKTNVRMPIFFLSGQKIV